MENMNKLIAKVTICCDTCGCLLKRKKTIKVNKMDFVEVGKKVAVWRESLKGQNCKICQSVMDAVNKQPPPSGGLGLPLKPGY